MELREYYFLFEQLNKPGDDIMMCNPLQGCCNGCSCSCNGYRSVH